MALKERPYFGPTLKRKESAVCRILGQAVCRATSSMKENKAEKV